MGCSTSHQHQMRIGYYGGPKMMAHPDSKDFRPTDAPLPVGQDKSSLKHVYEYGVVRKYRQCPATEITFISSSSTSLNKPST